MDKSLGAFVGSLLCGSVLAAEGDFADRLNLEVHGFVSFGYLQSWGNDWLGGTEGGSTEFHEAGANFIARPMERLRLGVQLFARDLGRYDNGRAELDWAYVDYRASDAIGVQVGRYKYPLGLYNEVLDVDAARVSVFLPTAIYALRARDLYLSADGGKIYGYIPAGSGGFEYVVHAGMKHFDEDGGFVTYMGELGNADPGTTSVSADFIFGAMLHWYTPINGLGLRLSFADAHGFLVESQMSGFDSTVAVDDYVQAVASVLYEFGSWELATEYSRLWARSGELSVPAFAIAEEFHDNSHGGYASLTWHAKPWFDCYSALQVSRADIADIDAGRADSIIAAVRFVPQKNWTIKAEFRHTQGTLGAGVQPNGATADSVWQAMALKTTVDF